MTRLTPFLVAAALVLSSAASAQFLPYTSSAGQNAPTEAVKVRSVDKDGKVTEHVEQRAPRRDGYGNAQGNQHDLAIDGAFEGQTIAVLHLYVDPTFDFSLPKAALKEKGFSVYRWVNQPPSPKELEQALAKACQLWVISDSSRKLNDEHLAIIKRFFESGRGVYIWGDNEPYYADANALGEALLGVTMTGNLMGDQVVNLQKTVGGKTVGVRRGHLLSTGLEFLYEGITIATVQPNEVLEPLVYGSAGNYVAGFFDKGGKRAIFDGGFTRLYNKWDTAGTARYVKNAAAWLTNAERFGDQVVSAAVKKR
jgi:hypothetical protein